MIGLFLICAFLLLVIFIGFRISRDVLEVRHVGPRGSSYCRKCVMWSLKGLSNGVSASYSAITGTSSNQLKN
ncbi:unnamed protein product [Chironomus riparius]|uniref:Uncharacterized protein n=1 Tax=Chironomus riparius TaxID=315576 RepID=A0A9N9WS42_9DIPT|nr:unnamed protein product [Chironomus riparius]